MWFAIVIVCLSVCEFGATCNVSHGKTTCITEDLLQMMMRINTIKAVMVGNLLAGVLTSGIVYGLSLSKSATEDAICIDSRLQPVFFALLKQNPFTLTGINDVVKFEDVTVNRGHGYNPSTGVFTAPRKGLYHISCNIMAHDSSNVHYQLIQNDAVHTNGYSNNGGYMSSTINAIVEMKKGDRVFIKHSHTSSQKINGNHHSTFSGFFMQE